MTKYDKSDNESHNIRFGIMKKALVEWAGEVDRPLPWLVRDICQKALAIRAAEQLKKAKK